MRSQVFTLCFSLLACATAAAAPVTPTEFPAEKLRKALDQPRELDIAGEELSQAIEKLSRQTDIPFRLDPALQAGGTGFPGGPPALTIRGARQKVGVVLRHELAAHGLAHVIVGDKVLITTAERAPHLALRQTVSVELKAVPLDRALEQLARESAVNIVLDPQVGKECQTALTLRFADVTLEVAVRVLSTSAGLHSVRLDNMLFVTSPTKARRLSADAADLRAPLPAVNPFQVPGGMLGIMGGGVGGQFGALGVGGGAGLLGVGGGGGGPGAGGMMGGAGIMGGGAGSAPPQQTRPKTPKKAPDGEKKEGAKDGRQGLALVRKLQLFEDKAQPDTDDTIRKIRVAEAAKRGAEALVRELQLLKDKAKPEDRANLTIKLAEAQATLRTKEAMLIALRREKADKVIEDKPARPGHSSNLKALLDTLRSLRDPRGNPVSFDVQDDPSLTLGVMLKALEDKFSRPNDNPPFYLILDLDRKAFLAEGVMNDPKDLGLGIDKAKIPFERNISLLTYLRKILDRVEGGPASGLTFLIRGDRIEITTNQRVLTECFGKRSEAERKGPLPPLVHAILEARPLDEALQELSEATDGYTVVIDASLKEAKTPVTATFRNVPLDTAVGALADMAGLTVVRKDNMLYVTSRKPAQPPREEKPGTSPAPPVQPEKPPMGEKKPGRPAGGQDDASFDLGVLVAARGAFPLAETAVRRVKAQPGPGGGVRAGNGNLKTLLDTLSIPRDAKGNPISFDEQGDPSLTLGLMLKALQDKFSRPGDNPPFYLQFEVDKKAFEAERVKIDPETLGLGTDKAKIPAEKNISLAMYLRKILERVSVPGGVTFVIRNDWVEITTNRRVLKECYGRRSKAELEGPLPPLVHAIIDARPLEDALRELAEAAGGYNVVVKGSPKEAKVPVTATFRNVPVDTAVSLLADMAGLVVERKDNVLYVTSREAAHPPTVPAAPMKPPMKEQK